MSTYGKDQVIQATRQSMDYTERMLAAFGWPITFSPGQARLTGDHVLRATDVDVPADFSSAAFFLVAASIVRGFQVHGFVPAFWGAAVLALLGMLIKAIVKDA